MVYIIQKKIEFKGKIVGAVIYESVSNKTFNIKKEDFKKYNYSNAKITSDNKIISKNNIPIVSLENVKRKTNSLILYHGSHNGIKGLINPTSSRELCDFGRGFYTGDLQEQAETLISGDENGVMYKLSVNLNNLNIYKFKDDIKWALYVGINRGSINSSKYPKLNHLVNQINSYDIVSGLIADDRMIYVYSLFMEGLISDTVLIQSLKHVKLGNQYVFKTQRACSSIKILEQGTLDEKRKKLLLHKKSSTIGKVQATVEDYIKKYRRTGKYIDEILEGYR